MVTSGVIRRNAQVRVIRDGTVIYETTIDSLKRFQDDAREVTEGFECGIHLANYDDVKVGDVLEAYETRAGRAHRPQRRPRRRARRVVACASQRRGRAATASDVARGSARADRRFVRATGYVGILSVELHFPEAGSLKGKRKFVKSAKAQLQNRFGASVAEVDHHELWQRARLTVACVAREHGELEALLRGAVRYLNGQEYELVSVEREVVVPGD